MTNRIGQITVDVWQVLVTCDVCGWVHHRCGWRQRFPGDLSYPGMEALNRHLQRVHCDLWPALVERQAAWRTHRADRQGIVRVELLLPEGPRRLGAPVSADSDASSVEQWAQAVDALVAEVQDNGRL